MPLGWEREKEKWQVGKPIKEEGEERSAVLVWNLQSPIGTCVCGLCGWPVLTFSLSKKTKD